MEGKRVRHNPPLKLSVRHRLLAKFSIQSGYPIVQENGVRFCGPPEHLRHLQEDTTCQSAYTEIFVGRLPRNIDERRLLPLFKSVGTVVNLRLMVDFTGANRGYCFVRYASRIETERAVETLDGYEIIPTCRIGVYLSVNNKKLFICNLDKTQKPALIESLVVSMLEGVVCVEVYPSYDGDSDKHLNRGYGYILFETHRMAAIGRRQLISLRSILPGNVSVDWAEPQPTPTLTEMMPVTSLFIRNFPIGTTFRQVYLNLSRYVNLGNIDNVYKRNNTDWCFVRFNTQALAEQAIRNLADAQVDGRKLLVDWARPNSIKRRARPVHLCVSVPTSWRQLVYSERNRCRNFNQLGIEYTSDENSCVGNVTDIDTFSRFSSTDRSAATSSTTNQWWFKDSRPMYQKVRSGGWWDSSDEDFDE